MTTEVYWSRCQWNTKLARTIPEIKSLFSWQVAYINVLRFQKAGMYGDEPKAENPQKQR